MAYVTSVDDPSISFSLTTERFLCVSTRYLLAPLQTGPVLVKEASDSYPVGEFVDPPAFRRAPAPCELIVLDVDESGTIIDPAVPEPRIRVDVFGSVSLRLKQSGEDIIDQIERCEPLVWQFRELGRAHAYELSQKHLLNEPVSALISGPRLSPLERLIFRALREDEDDGWLRWIDFSGDGLLEHFKSLIKHWLASDIDWAEIEYFDAGYNGQEMAKLKLQRLPRRVLKALGVVIEDVTHDGSTCRAARLQKSVVQANEVANLFGLAVRFSQHSKREGASNSKAFVQEVLS